MQRVVVVTALLGAVGLAIGAYPSADKRGVALNSAPIGRDADGPGLTPLQKLKAATRHEPPVETTMVPPAPRVVDSVRQDLQVRPSVSPPTAATKTTTIVAGTASTMAAAPARASASEPQALGRLEARLPAQVAPAVPALPAVAPTGTAAALTLEPAPPVVAAVTKEAVPRGLAGNPDVAKAEADKPDRSARSARHRPGHRSASVAPVRSAPASSGPAPSESATSARLSYRAGANRRSEGI